MCFGSWDIIFFATSVFRKSEDFSAGKVSETFKKKQLWDLDAQLNYMKIKSIQKLLNASLERSHAVLIKINFEFWSRASSF